MTAVVTATGLPSRAGIGLGRVLRSEWGKAWGLRSTRWAVATTVAINALLCLGASLDSVVGAEGYGYSLAYMIAGNLLFAQLPLLVLGVLMGAGEFSTGSVTTTVTAVPRRWLVLVAKTITVAATAAIASVLTLAVSALILRLGPLGPDLHLAWDDGQSVRMLAGGALAMTLLAVLALGIGMALRRPLLGIALAFALGLSELALMGAGGLAAWLPGHALLTVTASTEFLDVVDSMGTTAVGPWASIAVLAAWAALALSLAMIRLRRTDV